MARAHFVKSARKARRKFGIKKGDSYWWWQFRKSHKQYSKTRPKPSQLTRSEFYSSLYAIQEGLEGVADETAADDVRNAAEEVRSLGEEQRDKASNMESAFPGGCPTIDMLNERADACDTIADELDSAADEIQGLLDGESDDSDDVSEAIEGVISNVSFEV